MCFDQLRGQGYKIFGTSPKANSIPISELKADDKIALVFGNEHEGISSEVQGKVDGLVHIPMLGFTESFNISVSASIFLFDLVQKTQKLDIPKYKYQEISFKAVLKHLFQSFQ
jgi:tRNA (guanosine-2'-O-)-methyltransferase